MAEVLIAEFVHESNTFAPEPTTREDFRARREHFGEAGIEALRGTNTEVGGAIDAAAEAGIDLRPSVVAAAEPGGVVARDTYEFYADRIVADAREADPEGVLLVLHGAMVPEGGGDGEGPLVDRVSEATGGVPVVVTHDLHGNVSDRLVEATDALVAFETYPHVDMADTGRRAVSLLRRCIDGEIDPVSVVERPPVIPFSTRETTREEPMASIMELARELEGREGVLKVNVFPGFQRADVPWGGFSVPVVGTDERAARAAAREVARAIWERREAFVGDYPDPAEAVAEAADLVRSGEAAEGPVVLADVGDNPGGGGTADGTAVLRELIEYDLDAGFAVMRDPGVVAECVEAGVGERVTVTMGGKSGGRVGDPLDVEGYVKAITDGRFQNTGPMETGTETRLGRTVRFECGPDDCVTVALVENRVQPFDAELWRHLGVQPERLDAVVVKSTNHYRADYEPMASAVIPVNSPGLAAMDPRQFDYERLRRPLYPLDPMESSDYTVGQ